jgi:hypothetical protein
MKSVLAPRLKKALFSFLITGRANAMRWFTAERLSPQLLSEGPAAVVPKIIADLLGFPFFKAGELFFKVTYRFNQLRLRCICSEDFFFSVVSQLGRARRRRVSPATL